MKRLIAQCASVLLASGMALAEVSANCDRVLATIGPEAITLEEFSIYYPALAGFVGYGASEEEVTTALQSMILGRLLAREARSLQLDRVPEIRAQIEDILATHYLREHIPAERMRVDDAELNVYYNQHKDDYQAPRLFRAAHILVKTEVEATAISDAFETGADFELLANERSLDPATAPRGGDLGWLRKTEVLPALVKPLLGATPGQIIGPVQSEFGYHVLRLNELGPIAYQPFKSVRQRISESLTAEKQRALVAEVRKKMWAKYGVRIDRPALLAAIELRATGGGLDGASKPPEPYQMFPRLTWLLPVQTLVLPDQRVLMRALIVNRGDAPLIIEGLKSNCGCVEPEAASGTTLQPGEIGEIRFWLDPKQVVDARRSLTVSLLVNDPRAQPMMLRIDRTSGDS